MAQHNGRTTLTGDKELLHTLLQTSPRAARNILTRTVMASARRNAKETKRRANFVYGYSTGALKKSIKARKRRGSSTKIRASVYIDKSKGAGGRHWHLVEFGARGGNMPAQPFITPAFQESKEEWSQYFRGRFFFFFSAEIEKHTTGAKRVRRVQD